MHSDQVLRSDVDDTMFGKTWFAGTPVSSSVSGGGVFISPGSAGADQTLLGVAVSGVQKLRVDAEGDTTVAGNLTVDGAAAGGYGVQSFGVSGGGYFEDKDGSGSAFIGSADQGISAYGTLAGGYFSDSDDSGYAYVGWGNYGVRGFGTAAGGYFEDSAGSGYALVGRGDTGITAYGSSSGAYFQDSNTSSHAYIGIGDRGIEARGAVTGGYFESTIYGATAYVAAGLSGINAYSPNGIVEAVLGYNESSGTYGALGLDGVSTDGNGSKQFVQNHPYDEDKVIRYKSLEGDEVGTYTRGSGSLVNGVARIALGKTFQWVTNPDIGLTAHLTPRGHAADLFVDSLSTTELVVRGAAGSDAVFDYVVFGLRIGFEEQSVVADKQIESLIPAMEIDRDLFKRYPELREYTARGSRRWPPRRRTTNSQTCPDPRPWRRQSAATIRRSTVP